MLTNATVVARNDGATMIIELPDPGAGGLSRAALNQLSTVLKQANADRSVQVLLVLGASGAFCIGLDLAEFADESGLDELAEALRRCFSSFDALQKPLIAVVEGAAIGLGASIVYHADVVIAADAATFEAPFVTFGLLPEAGTTILAPARMGYLRAFRFFCLGERIGAQEAFAAGFVTEVALDPRRRGDEIAKRLAKLPSDALLTTRRLLRGNRKDVSQRIGLEIDTCRLRLNDPDMRRRIAMFATAASRRRRSHDRNVA